MQVPLQLLRSASGAACGRAGGVLRAGSAHLAVVDAVAPPRPAMAAPTTAGRWRRAAIVRRTNAMGGYGGGNVEELCC